MRRLFKLIYFIVPLVIITAFYFPSAKQQQDTIGKRVEELLVKMTLDEKIGQMTQMCFSEITLNGNKELDLHPELFKDAIINNHIGSFLSGTGDAQKWIDFIYELQRVAKKETRLGIPLIIGIDHIHGANYVDEGTMLPHNITLSCSFDTTIIASAARLTAIETADLGMSWNFAPVLDLGKNPYWPRLYETYGEDPYVCAEMGAAYITTYQNPTHSSPYILAACAKHFIGYSDPKSGWDRTPNEIPDQILYEHHLPAFKRAIDAGVKTVMLNSGEVNGVPVHVSEKLVKNLLREELGFDGVVVTDIKDIFKVYQEHNGAFSEKDATLRALRAGIDVSMSCNSLAFIAIVKELLDEGEITISRIDESVRRILKLKYELELFDNPFPRNDRIARIGSEEHLEQARKMAEESIVLLKNDNSALPLGAKGQRILVTGFAADSKKMLNGAWTLEWLGAEEERQPKNMLTLHKALQKEFPANKVSLFTTNTDGGVVSEIAFERAVKQHDVIILTLGEEPYSEFKGNISDLQLSDKQKKLAQIAGKIGKKVIYVLVQGRPRTITDIEKYAHAILFAGYPGQGGADAIAGIVSGRVNPSGKLSFSYPLYPGHHSPYYHKSFDKAQNLYEFGHGLSFTNFEYTIDESEIPQIWAAYQPVTLKVEITNIGYRPGKEVVLGFFRQEKGTITRPVKQLFHFEKVSLEAGESKMLEIVIDPVKVFSYPDEYNKMILEEGEFTIMIGDFSKKITLKKDLPESNL
jgi:beta-glucosidase